MKSCTALARECFLPQLLGKAEGSVCTGDTGIHACALSVSALCLRERCQLWLQYPRTALPAPAPIPAGSLHRIHCSPDIPKLH